MAEWAMQADVSESTEGVVVDGAAAGADAESTQETTQFVELAASTKVDFDESMDESARNDLMDRTQLASFLKRPVRIGYYNWTSSDSPGVVASFNPWQLFYNNSYIKQKLQNFAYVRSQLHVKILVNASPFQYGAMRAVYTPFQVGVPEVAGTTQQKLVQLSQRPGAWLEIGDSQGVEILCPFIYHRNFAKILVNQDFIDLGKLDLAVYYPLASANGVSTNVVSIQIFAWADDIELGSTTLGLAMQGDEYGTGPVSAPASALARVARSAKKIPVIGKFAAATEIGASAVSKIASLFGYTNVPVLDPPKPFRPTIFPQLASTEIGFPVEKLTLDSKNELAIDPSIVGGASEDPLAIENIVKRDSYVTSFNWDMTMGWDTKLFSGLVTPQYVINGTVGGQTTIQMIPTSMVAYLYQHWRGDLIFTFKFVASPFHKGRVRFYYDPQDSAVGATGDYGAVLQNTIVDLGVQRQIEIRVPYQQALSWCLTDTPATTFSTDPAYTLNHSDGVDNGVIVAKVATYLTSPVVSSQVGVLVFVRGAENLEFQNPRRMANLSPFEMQGEEYTMGVTPPKDENLYRINFGEKVTSLRQLLCRSTYVDDLIPDIPATGTYSNIFTWVVPRKIPFYGYDPHGSSTAAGITVPATNFPFQWSNLTPLTYLQRAFLAQRGAIHWHLNVTAASPITHVVASRYVQSKIQQSFYMEVDSGATNSAKHRTSVRQETVVPGGALTNCLQQSGLSFSAPNCTRYKFQSTIPGDVQYAGYTLPDGSDYEFMTIQMVTPAMADTGSSVRIKRFAAAGTDFSLYYFLHVPRWFYYPGVPAAASV